MAITDRYSNSVTKPRNTQWGALGDVVFQTHSSPNQVTDNRQWNWQAQKVINGYPVHQAGGESERTLNLEITLHNRFTNIAQTFQTLLTMAQTQIPRALVIGSEMRGKFAVKSLREVLTETSPEGVVVAVRYSLQLFEVRGEKNT